MKILKSVFLLVILSCSSEQASVSPINLAETYNTISAKYSLEKQKAHTDTNFYASELTGVLASIPKFENQSLNQEVRQLKFYVREYIYAVEAYNVVGQEKAKLSIEKSYAKIQKLRKNLNTNDDEFVNRYLVKIKNNISKIEAQKKS